MIWKILEIEKTKDREAITAAYREKLRYVNPEDDEQGFMELRRAYEEALEYAAEEENESLHNIDNQLAAIPNYNKCSVQEVEREVGITFWEYFRMVHNFMEFNELDDVGNGKRDITSINGMTADDTDINLFISYHLYDNNIGISYISKGNII